MKNKILLLLTISFTSVTMWAWGPKGHDVVAEIASRHISKKTAAKSHADIIEIEKSGNTIKVNIPVGVKTLLHPLDSNELCNHIMDSVAGKGLLHNMNVKGIYCHSYHCTNRFKFCRMNHPFMVNPVNNHLIMNAFKY